MNLRACRYTKPARDTLVCNAWRSWTLSASLEIPKGFYPLLRPLHSHSPPAVLWVQGPSEKHSCLQLSRPWKGPIVGSSTFQFVSNTAGTRSHQGTLMTVPQEIMKYPYIYLPSAPLTSGRKQASPLSDPAGGDMPICASRARSTNLSLGSGTWNSHRSQWLTLLGMVQSQSCLGSCPVIRQEFSKSPGRSHTHPHT